MKAMYTFLILLAAITGNSFAQSQLTQVCHSENFDIQSTGWITSNGAKEDYYADPSDSCVQNRGIVTPGVGGNDPAVITSPKFVSTGALMVQLSFDIFVFNANMSCASWKDFACPTSIDVFYYTGLTKHNAIIDLVLPHNGNSGSPKVDVVFAVGDNLPAGTEYSVELDFKQKSGIGNCTQSGTKYAVDNVDICEIPCLDCTIDAVNDNFCSQVNILETFSGDLTTNDSKYDGAVVVYSLANGPYANGSSVVGGADLTVYSNGLFTIKRTDITKTVFDFTYKITEQVLGLTDLASVKVCFPEGGPLPVILSDFYGTRKNNNVLLNWKTTTENNITVFDIQKKISGEFVTVGSVNASATYNGNAYAYIDYNNSTGITEYRLKMVQTGGAVAFSEIRPVKGLRTESDFVVYPNPSNGSARIMISDISDQLNIELIDNTGRTIRKILTLTNSSVDLNDLRKGIYLIRLTRATGQSVTKKFVVNK